MNPLFKNLQEQAGVHASMVLDGTGQLLAHEGNALYDEAILQDVSAHLTQALDSVDLLHSDWDEMQVQFADGSIMLRNLGILPNQNGRTTLAVISDATLNRSFATISMRVVAQKLKQALSTGAGLEKSANAQAAPRLPNSGSQLAASQSSLDNANSSTLSVSNASGYAISPSAREQPGGKAYLPAPHPSHTSPSGFGSEISPGLAWSGVDNNKSSGFGVGAVDEQSLRLLRQLSKSLAPYVGPMAKVFVKEAVQRVCSGEPFSTNHLGAVVKLLELQVEDPNDYREFILSIKAV